MYTNGIRIGRIFGIDIKLHRSWFIIFILTTWALTAVYFPITYPAWSMAMKISAGLLTSFLYFASILTHELSHSVVSIKAGLPIKGITLFFLGGAAELSEEPKNARDEFRISSAGPASSLILGAVFIGIYYAFRGSDNLAAQFVTAVSQYLSYINLFVGLFNLLPGFPLDGGRIFRSIVWWRTGSLQRATKVASTIGQLIGNLLIFGGLFLVFSGNLFNGMWLAFIGFFVKSSAAGNYSQMIIQDMLKGHTVMEIMSQDCTAVPPDISIERVVNDVMLRSGRRCYPVVSDGQAEGLITLTDVKGIDRDAWGMTPVRQAMTPLHRMKTVAPTDDLSTVLKLLGDNDINQVPVVENGNIVGMIARDNIISFINVQAQLKQ